MTRRPLTYTSLADIPADVARLLPAHTTVGQWSLAQILNHLTSAFTWPVDGFPVRPLPLPIRLLLGKPGFAYMFHTGRIPQGLPLPKRHCPTPDLDLPTESARLTAAIVRYSAHTGPIAIHPLAGQLTRARYDRYQLIHSAHHLSFAVFP